MSEAEGEGLMPPHLISRHPTGHHHCLLLKFCHVPYFVDDNDILSE
jgi:hypothetical protein